MVIHGVRIILMVCIVALSACGGGGSDGSINNKTYIRPTAVIAPPANNVVVVGEVATFKDGGSDDPDARIGSGPLTYKWSFKRPNGSLIAERSGSQVNHTFTQAGMHTVVLRVIDADELYADTSITVRVADKRVTVNGSMDIDAGSGSFTVDSDVPGIVGVDSVVNSSEAKAQYIQAPLVISGHVDSAQAAFDEFLGKRQWTMADILTGNLVDILAGNPLAIFSYLFDLAQLVSGFSVEQGFDEYDYYQAALTSGQTITLNTLGHGHDANTRFSLALVPLEGTTPAALLTTGAAAVESLTVPADGNYYLIVCPVKGRGKYLLDIGGAADITLASSAINTGNMQPGQMIVQYNSQREQGPQLQSFAAGPQRSISSISAPIPTSTCYERLAVTHAKIYQQLQTASVIQQTNQHQGIDWAAPNYRRQISAISDVANDLRAAEQFYLPALNMESAWAISKGTTTPSIIAVIDNGFKLNHEDLSGRFIGGYDFVRNVTQAGDSDGIDNDPTDPGIRPDGANKEPDWHGTHIAGIIGANSNNTLGIAGISWGGQLMPLRALAGNFGYSYDIIQAMRYAAGLSNDSGSTPAQAANIINLSFGSKDFSRAEQETINEIRRRGIFVIAAAGNANTAIAEYPAAYDNVVAVGSVNRSRKHSVYTKRANWVDVYAYGGDSNLDSGSDLILSTSADNSGSNSIYRGLYGTSMAAAQISGIVALMRDVYPGLKPGHLDQLLASGDIQEASTASESAAPNLIDAHKALQQAQLLQAGSKILQNQVLASPANVTLGPLSTSKQIELVPQVTNTYNINTITADAASTSWLSATSIMNGLRIDVNNSGLTAGEHTGTLTVTFSGGVDSLEIPVTYKHEVSSNGKLPPIIFKFWDKDLNQTLVVDATYAGGSVYPGGATHNFVLNGIPTGRYCLYYSSDIDGKVDVLCDKGEFCGTYGSFANPAELQLNDNVAALKNPDNSDPKLILLTPKKLPSSVDFSRCSTP